MVKKQIKENFVKFFFVESGIVKTCDELDHFVWSSGFQARGPSKNPNNVKTWQLNSDISKQNWTALSL